MSIIEKLLDDYKQAMREKNIIKKNTIQLLRANLLLEEKNLGHSITPDEAEKIILKEKKNRLDTIAQAEKLQAVDLKEQAQKELLYINEYLPKQLSEVELTDEVKTIIAELNADSKMLGQVIATAKTKLGAKADGKMISDIAKQLLNI